MKLFKLKQNINSPSFVREIESGRIYTDKQIKQDFGITQASDSFSEWFEDVSDVYEIKHCKILKLNEKERGNKD